MKTPNPKTNFFFEKEKQWQVEFETLRHYLLQLELNEDVKWGCACYTLDNKNIVLIHGFKEYCALLFFKGALLKDPNNQLIQQTKNVQAARQFRFTNLKEIIKHKAAIINFTKEAIELEKSGAKIVLKKTNEFEMPEEFAEALKQDNKLKKAFESLTPGRQRAYLLFFSSAKQSKTRVARIEKATPAIMNGKGLND